VNETRDLESIIEAQRDLIAEQRRGLALREARIAELEAALREMADAIPQSYDWYQRRARNILNQGG